MPINSNPTIRQRRLARRLRELRSAAGMTHADVATVLGSAESKVGRIENAQSGIRLPDLRAWMDATNVTDPAERAEIEELSREAKKKGWWSRYTNAVDSAYAAYVAVEWDAAELYNVETNLIPGLLQTPDYTRALIELQAPDATKGHVETQINVRRERRKVLTRDCPLQLWVIIAESVLHHRVGSPEVMKAQLEALVEDSRGSNVQLQVLPQDDPMNACLFGPFVIMSFPTSAETDIIYAESPTSTLYYEEPADVDTYTTLFRRLNMAAANVSNSRALILDAIKEMK
ncbi:MULTISPECIES: helix-turn-helix transcriptional regulator [unclassified Streptomyces]|uniref:helix-turn-helix domain-containing protein n=1 Tax=unclassified Streptomyces TaxID=2593676 RepID=UPI0001C1BFF6|nr:MULTISPECIES: helix-turn-helix transcriptional regulator [unclassified Streptomyces]MYR66656.1 helix-turn-helix domain-containing protein [Streptomyces sp. SID4939]MYS03205.1 helix-turn-helix domain-containing protein [Streptomyces sp. SID4940]MYT66902.1 helix-turn-helix domain-containing protein [Streptomyces sp. SID8357]MYT88321.1 helix-turn-helix domain-containing protein [Streptomyces sp. SID8360]MYU33236.1 helix-turn-helix domain-containing protein [Streptomyces sp. SID8358]MYW39512.1